MNVINLDCVKEKLNFDFDICLNSDIEEKFSTKFDGLCHIKGSIKKKDNDSLIIKLKIEQSYIFTCFKCLDLVKFHLLHNVDEEILNDSEFINSNTFNLNEYINQEVFLNMPSRVVCSETCKGLCPICGINKNLKTCSCKEERVSEDNPFIKLEELILKDWEV